MRRILAFLLTVGLMLVLCSCGDSVILEKESVVEEIYTGSEYMTIEDAHKYISGFLGASAEEYEVEIYDKLVRFSLKEDSRDTDWLDRNVDFSDGTSVSLPCNYADVKSLGWKAEGSENETWISSSTFYCHNDTGWRIGFVRDLESNENNIKIKDSKIERLSIACGDFAKKDNHVLVLSCHPEFEYMGISRKSTPTQVVHEMGLPKTIEHNGVNMTFEYASYDYSIKEKTSVEVEWLTLKDGPEIMRGFDLGRIYMDWLLW